MDELVDRFDDEHLTYLFARYLIGKGMQSKEQHYKEMARNLGSGV